jgi:hypothetical protein
MVLARAVDPAADEFGHRRSGVYSDAVNLLKTSARLGHTIAELRGSKFEHNINVRREQIDGRREKVVDSNANAREDEEESGEPDWEFRKYKGHDYDPSVRFKDGKFFIRGGPGFCHVPDDWDEERWKAGLPQRSEEGTPLAISQSSNGNPEAGDPPSNSQGSNGNSEISEAIGARIRSL